MPNLIEPIFNYELTKGEAEIREAHRFIVQCAKASFLDARSFDVETWGRTVKRKKIKFPKQNRPQRVRDAADEHSYAEIVNQCATVERLLDVMVWARNDLELSEYNMIKVCHPTTSSLTKKGRDSADNDLILVNQLGEEVRFEVSDVASSKDGNGKELKDIAALGALRPRPGSKIFDPVPVWPLARLFLAVSKDMGAQLKLPPNKNSKYRNTFFHYRRVNQGDGTMIFEVNEGGPDRGP